MFRLATMLVWLSIAMALIGFYLPWAKIDVSDHELLTQLRKAADDERFLGLDGSGTSTVTATVRQGSATIAGELPKLSEIPREVSGAQIPKLANQPNAQVAVALLELLTNERQGLKWKSIAVCLIPAVAFLFGLLLTFMGDQWDLAATIGGLCAIIAGVGFWKVLNYDGQNLLITITLREGLWLSLWAYVGLAVSAALQALLTRSASVRKRADW